ncbi:MAG: hypothetical protein OXC46_10120 [Thaumarchaeota archaeon]|nr:hypothetical protein [Nitrososphaerota archaeon]
MAISEKIQGDNTYLTYGYWDGSKHVRIYCGKKGETSTLKKLQEARRRHYEVKLRRMQVTFEKAK